MRHGVDGRKFGRNTSSRLAMFRNMANSVIAQEQIITTIPKAKEIRRVVDRLITLGKSGSPASRRLAFDRTRDNDVVKKLFTELATRYKSRPGGYTRILKMAERRWGDAAEMAVIELVDHPPLDRKKKPTSETKAKAAADKATDDLAKANDPLSRFKKVFQGGGKGKVGAGAGKAGKGGAGRKTPSAGGGGSKSGGSSS